MNIIRAYNGQGFWNEKYKKNRLKIKRERGAAMSRVLRGARKCPNPYTKEVVPPPGKILTLKETVLNFLHFNMAYRMRLAEHSRTYINSNYTKDIIADFHIPETLKTELIDLTKCNGCIKEGYHYKSCIFPSLYRLRLNPEGEVYHLLEKINASEWCSGRELWEVIRDHGVISNVQQSFELFYEIRRFLITNIEIIVFFKWDIPKKEIWEKETIRYSLQHRPADIRPKGIPPPTLPEDIVLEDFTDSGDDMDLYEVEDFFDPEDHGPLIEF